MGGGDILEIIYPCVKNLYVLLNRKLERIQYNMVRAVNLFDWTGFLNSAVCMNCFGDAAFTKRTSEEESLEVHFYTC